MGKERLGKYVECEVCMIQFYINPSRFKNKHHTCSKKCLGVLSSKLQSKKVITNCNVCDKEIEYKLSHFKQIQYHTCSAKCRSVLMRTVYRGENNPKAVKLTKEDRWFSEKCQDYKRRALLKKIEFDLDFNFLKELFYNQAGFCYYSSIPMVMYSDVNRKISAASYNVASLDRIDSDKGYTKDNVVWCLNSINMFKAHHKLEDIKNVMKGIVMTETSIIQLKFKKLSANAVAPKYSRPGDSGLDLVATDMKFDTSNNSIIYSTGIAVQIPPGFTGLLIPRSSVIKTSLTLYNNVGIIDSNFRGEIKAVFKNVGSTWYKIGDRIAQLVLVPTPEFEPVETQELSETERGVGSFGSSGA